MFPLAGYRTRWLFKNKQGEIRTIPVKGRTIISNAISLQECAIAGMGLALLPHWLVEPEVKSKLIEVLSEYKVTATDFTTSSWPIDPFRSYVPLKVKVFIDFLKQHLTDK